MLTLSNRQVEDRAIDWVIRLERSVGRAPRDMRGVPGYPADIESPPRIIEVKAYGLSARGQDLWLEPVQVEEALSNPDFHLYVVENVRAEADRDFVLRVLTGTELRGLLERRREHRYFTLPWPVAQYDALSPVVESNTTSL